MAKSSIQAKATRLLCAMALPVATMHGNVAVADEEVWQNARSQFVSAFNERDWSTVASITTEDSAFHRANSEKVFNGPKEIVERFSSEIGANDGWNVQFAKLDTTESTTGLDGSVVERGIFAVTAGAAGNACYAGSYLMTWIIANDNARLKALAWQDVEVDISQCQ